MSLIRPKLTRSVRCHIRRQKSAIRRGAHNPAEQERLIAELYGKFGVEIR